MSSSASNQLQSPFLPFAVGLLLRLLPAESNSLIHLFILEHGFGRHGDLRYFSQAGGGAWNGSGWEGHATMMPTKNPWQQQQGMSQWEIADPSRQMHHSSVGSAPAGMMGRVAGESRMNWGGSSPMTGTQILNAALKLEELLQSNRISPEEAMEATLHYQQALFELSAQQQRKPAGLSLLADYADADNVPTAKVRCPVLLVFP